MFIHRKLSKCNIKWQFQTLDGVNCLLNHSYDSLKPCKFKLLKVLISYYATLKNQIIKVYPLELKHILKPFEGIGTAKINNYKNNIKFKQDEITITL